ncbi:hypothetical protein AALO_G00204420 [Alosa alosa]|uniref:Secreted protein n=1 Tax=Alosa alosa TaxID=278164 RepID=A0AAV6G3N0_9TELE|nr:uncharacterized protein LOC125307843 isoform X1 [Alosa alosa]KAG5269653.1 hypothetical protein AALO_G00204420 [Alosa alosa]
MIVTMLTAMYMMVKAAEQLGVRWGKEPEPLPYMLSQPIPWQIHSVSNSRRGSRAEERRNSLYRKNSGCSNGGCPPASPAPDSNCSNGGCPPTSPETVRAAATIQKEYRKYQQKKKDAN